MCAEPVAGATYLLGNLYTITEESSDVLVYTGHGPYDLSHRIHVDGMLAVDIATSYVDICVYVLDNGNGRVSRIDQKHNTDTFIDGLERGSLLSMSVNRDGRLTILQRNSRILTYGRDGRVLGDRRAPIEDILHAVEIDEKTSVFCDARGCVKTTYGRQEAACKLDEIGCRYVDMNKNGDLIACDLSEHQVVKLNPKTLQVIATLLTLERDGIESPRHVRCVLENGLMLVSWLHFLDVYTFRRNTTQGYLASPAHDIRNQRIREASEIEREIVLSPAFQQLSKTSGIEFDVTPSQPQQLEQPATASAGKNTCIYPK